MVSPRANGWVLFTHGTHAEDVGCFRVSREIDALKTTRGIPREISVQMSREVVGPRKNPGVSVRIIDVFNSAESRDGQITRDEDGEKFRKSSFKKVRRNGGSHWYFPNTPPAARASRLKAFSPRPEASKISIVHIEYARILAARYINFAECKKKCKPRAFRTKYRRYEFRARQKLNRDAREFST